MLINVPLSVDEVVKGKQREGEKSMYFVKKIGQIKGVGGVCVCMCVCVWK